MNDDLINTYSNYFVSMYNENKRKEEIEAVNKKYDKQNELDGIQNKIREHTNAIYELQKRERELKGETEWWRK